MNEETLLEKRDSIQKKFEEQDRIKLEAESEQLRLQGEHRLVNYFLEKVQAENNDGGNEE